ncbi:hypothetical protein FJZ48_03395 [Candidatus Uhrbacteria bacterium]|nr:hypothetical protein [Candidatus Uhrbacteria bacterium]
MKNLLLHLKNAWMRFAHALGRINTAVLLTLFFLFVIGGMSIISKLWNIFVKPSRVGWQQKQPMEPTLDWASHQF